MLLFDVFMQCAYQHLQIGDSLLLLPGQGCQQSRLLDMQSARRSLEPPCLLLEITMS